jgi:hypothetical protein
MLRAYIAGLKAVLRSHTLASVKVSHRHAYIAGLKQHLNKGGQGWLVLSDLAEHLGVMQLVVMLVKQLVSS